jgi:hypothetical protein
LASSHLNTDQFLPKLSDSQNFYGEQACLPVGRDAEKAFRAITF